MIKLATEEQAKEIADLTYEIYQVKGSENPNLLIPFKRALDFDFNTAMKLIDDLEQNLKKTEIYVYLKKYDGTPLIEIPRIKLINNYLVINNFAIDYKNNILNISTDKGTISFANKQFRSEMNLIEMKEVESLLTKAINQNQRVNIFIIDNYVRIFAEDAKRDKDFASKIQLLNEITDYTYGYIKEGSIRKVFPLLKRRNIDLYKHAEKIIDPSYEQSILRIIISTKRHEYNLCFQNDIYKMPIFETL